MAKAEKLGIRKNIENSFEAFALLVYRNRLKAIIIMAVIIGGFVSNLPNIKFDTSTESFLHEDDPLLVSYEKFRDQFGRDEMSIIAINPENVFDLQFLKKLKAFHDELEGNVPYIEDIISLVNARNVRGEGDDLIVEDLLENFPESEEDIAKLKERVLKNPFYKNLLVSADGGFTTVVLKANTYTSSGTEEDMLAGFDEDTEPVDSSEREFLTDAENSEMIEKLEEIAAKYDGADFPISIAGSPVFIHSLKQAMQKDMQKFVLLAISTVAILLYLMFGRISAVILPLLIVILSLLSTVGIMAMMGTAIKLPTQILPSFLLAVGIGDSVHVFAIFFHRLRKGDGKEEAIGYAIGHSGLAILMTSLTTAAGLLSFSTAEIAPVADIGIYASTGIMLAFFYTIVLLPALISLLPIRDIIKKKEHARHERMDKILIAIADFSTSRAKGIVATGIIVIVISIAFASNLRFEHNPLEWLPDSMEIKGTTKLIDKELRGTVSIETIIDTGKENGLYDPDLLKRMDALALDAETYDKGDVFVGKAWSVASILKEINKALNENRDEFYSIPDNEKLVAQEFLLFENSGSDDLEDVVDSQFRQARLTIKVPWLEATKYGDFIDDIKEMVSKHIGDDVSVDITGMVPIFGGTLHSAMVSMGKSYVTAGLVISLMMIVLMGSFKVGLLSMIPNLAPITIAMGVMYVFSLPLDMFTMMIGSIAIGLAVDDTVHFLHNFRRYFEKTGDVREAVRHTLLTTGRAMLTTTVVLSSGFFVYLFATMSNIVNFGLLTGLAIVLALVADFLLAPAIMTLVTKKKSMEV